MGWIRLVVHRGLSSGGGRMILAELLDACDASERRYREDHKNDPCERCGSTIDVTIILTGSIGRLTSLCRQCDERGRAVCSAFNNGITEGIRLAMSRPWWQRIRGKA